LRFVAWARRTSQQTGRTDRGPALSSTGLRTEWLRAWAAGDVVEAARRARQGATATPHPMADPCHGQRPATSRLGRHDHAAEERLAELRLSTSIANIDRVD